MDNGGRNNSHFGDNDVHVPFSAACGSRDILRKKLQLTTYCQDRTFEPENVIRRLRFLSIPIAAHGPLPATTTPAAAKTCTKCAKYPSFDTGRNVSDSNTSSQICTLRLTNPGDLESCNHYVAVSYCWQQPQNLPGDKTFRPEYTILDGNKKRESRAPPNIIQRAIEFAIFKGYHLVWIDQECIDQDDVQDKLLHVQAMHLIYRQACDVVAVINSVLSNQVQADILECGSYSTIEELYGLGHLESSESRRKIGHDLVAQTLQLAESLAGDLWYTRAWTYQEALLATRPVYLLIPCDSNLRAPSFKTADGSQLVILDTKVLQALRSMERSFDRLLHFDSNSPESSGYSLWLEDSDCHNTEKNKLSSALDVLRDSVPGWKDPPVDVALDCHRLSALDAIQPLLRRRITEHFDLVAICGNLCNYKIRLDTHMVRKSGIGLSVALFALALLNGDLSLVLALNHNTSCFITDQSKALPSASIRDVATMPHRHEFIDWVPESIFSCRVRSPTLLSDGLLIRGILWRVEYVDLNIIRQRYIPHQDSILRRECPVTVAWEIINATCQFLRDKKETALVQAIENHRSQMEQDLVFQIMLHHFIPIAVPEDPTVSDCRLLPGTAYQYGRVIVLFTPYRVLIEAESQDEMPQFLLVWPIHSVRTSPIITQMFSQGRPCKMKADGRLFYGDAKQLLTRSTWSEKMYRLYCF
jgi:hypothetical protein